MVNKIVWIVIALFVIGNGFFIMPWQLCSENVSSQYQTMHKKDSDLLRAVFPDSPVYLRLNVPPIYRPLVKSDSVEKANPNKPYVAVNVSILNNIDFTSLCFPFYKSLQFNSMISFYSVIKVENQPWRDSTVLIGNTSVSSNIIVKGICTPLHVRDLAEQELAGIVRKEMKRIEQDINYREPPDTMAVTIVEPIPRKTKKAKRR